MLCDLVPGKDSDAQRIAATRNPAEELDGLALKSIETVKLAKLHALVAEKKYNAVKDLYDLVAQGDDEGPWVVRVPDELTTGLAALDGATQKRIAAEWAKAEELVRDGWKPADVTSVLAKMCALARKTTKAKMSLFLWMSL